MKDLSVEFICPNCHDEFKLHPHEILEKEIISCPQCSCTLSEDEIKDLKVAIKHMLEAN